MSFDSCGFPVNIAAVSKVSDQIASWDTNSELGTKAVLLHPFKPLVCTADDKEIIRYHFNLLPIFIPIVLPIEFTP